MFAKRTERTRRLWDCLRGSNCQSARLSERETTCALWRRGRRKKVPETARPGGERPVTVATCLGKDTPDRSPGGLSAGVVMPVTQCESHLPCVWRCHPYGEYGRFPLIQREANLSLSGGKQRALFMGK